MFSCYNSRNTRMSFSIHFGKKVLSLVYLHCCSVACIPILHTTVATTVECVSAATVFVFVFNIMQHFKSALSDIRYQNKLNQSLKHLHICVPVDLFLNP